MNIHRNDIIVLRHGLGMCCHLYFKYSSNLELSIFNYFDWSNHLLCIRHLMASDHHILFDIFEIKCLSKFLPPQSWSNQNNAGGHFHLGQYLFLFIVMSHVKTLVYKTNHFLYFSIFPMILYF